MIVQGSRAVQSFLHNAYYTVHSTQLRRDMPCQEAKVVGAQRVGLDKSMLIDVTE